MQILRRSMLTPVISAAEVELPPSDYGVLINELEVARSWCAKNPPAHSPIISLGILVFVIIQPSGITKNQHFYHRSKGITVTSCCRARPAAWYSSQRKASSRNACLARFSPVWWLRGMAERLRHYALRHARHTALGNHHGPARLDAGGADGIRQNRGGERNRLGVSTCCMKFFHVPLHKPETPYMTSAVAISSAKMTERITPFSKVLAAALAAVADGDSYLPVRQPRKAGTPR